MTTIDAPLVLVVDDEPVFLRASLRLVQRDRPAIGARSLPEALFLVRAPSHAITWILSDVRLGLESGLDLWDALAEIAPLMRARMSFMTGGNLSHALAARLQRSGCPTLVKPVEPAVLRSHLLERLGSP